MRQLICGCKPFVMKTFCPGLHGELGVNVLLIAAQRVPELEDVGSRPSLERSDRARVKLSRASANATKSENVQVRPLKCDWKKKAISLL